MQSAFGGPWWEETQKTRRKEGVGLNMAELWATVTRTAGGQAGWGGGVRLQEPDQQPGGG